MKLLRIYKFLDKAPDTSRIDTMKKRSLKGYTLTEWLVNLLHGMEVGASYFFLSIC